MEIEIDAIKKCIELAKIAIDTRIGIRDEVSLETINIAKKQLDVLLTCNRVLNDIITCRQGHNVVYVEPDRCNCVYEYDHFKGGGQI
jgi:hypothetical protein